MCHFDGTLDAHTWVGFPNGPRNTLPLLGVGRTLPIHWAGDLDELADVELTIRKIQASKGLTPGDDYDSLGPRYTDVSEALNALAAYLDSLEVPPSPLTAATLEDVFSFGDEHDIFDRVTPQELSDLIDFLLALPLE